LRYAANTVQQREDEEERRPPVYPVERADGE
jgi:hypothetical protein